MRSNNASEEEPELQNIQLKGPFDEANQSIGLIDFIHNVFFEFQVWVKCHSYVRLSIIAWDR